MMAFLLKYLLIGAIVGLILETLVDKVSNDRFTGGERLYIILLWPLSLMVFLYGFFNKGE
jgi:hypothetical protein